MAPPLIPSTPTIIGLPNEIIQRIATYLCPAHVACLTLTCRRMLVSLGTGSWLRITDDLCECVEFIFLLGPRSTTPNSAWPIMYSGGESSLYSGPFNYLVGWLHALLSCLQYPTHSVNLDKYADTTYRSLGKGRLLTCRLVVTPRIVAGYVLIKATYTFVSSTDEDKPEFWHLCDVDAGICKHTLFKNRREPWHDNTFASALRSFGNHRWNPSHDYDASEVLDDSNTGPSYDDILGPTPPSDGISLRQCSFCVTEYDASLQGSTETNSIVLNVWTNLGRVRPLSSNEFEENNKLWEAFTGRGAKHDVQVHFYPLGSVKNAFEHGDGSKLGDVRYTLD